MIFFAYKKQANHTKMTDDRYILVYNYASLVGFVVLIPEAVWVGFTGRFACFQACVLHHSSTLVYNETLLEFTVKKLGSVPIVADIEVSGCTRRASDREIVRIQ